MFNPLETLVILTFLSTLSLRRATMRQPRESIGTLDFYPRSPCGERHETSPYKAWENQFLSTLSLRRATIQNARARLDILISIHALLAESDPVLYTQTNKNEIFLATLSLRRATLIWRYLTPKALKFLSTLSLRRATYYPR